MFQLVMVILALLLAIAFTSVGMDYTGNTIINKERAEQERAFNRLLDMNEQYTSDANMPLPIANWKNELMEYGHLPVVPPNYQTTYNYNETENKYYFCIFNNNADSRAHESTSRLRYGFPRSSGTLSTNRGYTNTYFNVNQVCGSSTDYYEDGVTEPTEGGNVDLSVAATMWIGGYEKYYIERSQSIGDDFINLKNVFDAYVADNGVAPSTALTIDQVFDELRSYGQLPQLYDRYQWSYDISSGSHYFCISTTDTTDYSEIYREIHAESVYQLVNKFAESYFKVNRTSCTSSSQSRTTDYLNPISVYASYILN
jgi:type II secretory pathway pseudopilin PulG